MSLLNKLKPQMLFKADKPDDLRNYIGRTIIIGGKPVKIESICGNKFRPQFFEINGEYLVGMLRFYAQLNGARDISEEQFRAFEEMDVEAEKLPPENDPLRMKV